MSGFEALFAFYALLLGLAIANVSNSFADMYSRRKRDPVGWTVPLLGVVVILAATQQWLSLYGAQGGMTLEPLTILSCLVMALPYIVIGRLMVPHGGEPVGLEDHYASQRMLLVGMLLLPVVISLVFNLYYDVIEGIPLRGRGLFYGLYHGLRLGILVPMLLWPSRPVQRTGLAALGIYTLVLMFTG